MQHGTYQQVDGRPALCFERRLPHPVDAVWAAVTEPGELAHWFPAEVRHDARAGGAIAFHFAGGEGPDGDGTVLAYEPPHRFAFTWADDELRIELEPLDDGAGCLLRFMHLLDAADRASRDAAGWHVCLDALAARLDGEPADGQGDWRGLYDEYRRRGLPEGAPVPGGA